MKTIKYLPILVLSVLMSSCVVSKKKYEIAESGRLAAIYSRDSLSRVLTADRKSYEDLLAKERARIAQLCKDTARAANTIRNYEALLTTNANENQKLNTLLSEKQTELGQKMKELEEREKTIRDLNAKIKAQNEKVANLLASVKNALTGFSSDEIAVRQEGGKVYVAMSEKLLFQSGKADVNEQGVAALGKLAEVLKKQKDIDINIEGHTDSKPIKTATFKDNWDLSVIRATSVTRILTQTYGVDPLQILPSGRSEYKPVDTNTTDQGRQHNRRTEIILTPNLDELMKILESADVN